MTRPQRKAAAKAIDLLSTIQAQEDLTAQEEEQLLQDKPAKKRVQRGEPRKINTAPPESLAKIYNLAPETLAEIVALVAEDDEIGCTRTFVNLQDAYPEELKTFFDGRWWQAHVNWKWDVHVAPKDARRYALATISEECSGCGTTAGVKPHAILANTRVCESCRSEGDWALITATRAKSEYKLNEKDLSQLNYLERPNPHYRSGYPMMQIRRISEAKQAAKNSTLAEAKIKSQKRSAKAKQTKIAKRDARQTELETALSAKGLQLRADSRLCADYIDGKRDAWSLSAIVDRMMDMHLLHVHGRWDAWQQDAYAQAQDMMDEERDHYGGRYGGHYGNRYGGYHGGHESFQSYYEPLKDAAEASCLAELSSFEQQCEQNGSANAAQLCACGHRLLKHLIRGPVNV